MDIGVMKVKVTSVFWKVFSSDFGNCEPCFLECVQVKIGKNCSWSVFKDL